MTAASNQIQGWNLNKVLGSGGFGIVELWAHTSGKKLAIKICKKDLSQLTEAQKRRWINEVQLMKCLKHPNIVKGLDLPFKHPDDKIDLPLLCMEFCRNGDLRKVLNRVENCCGVSEKEAVNVMKDISSAVEYLHSNNITHRDLKPENIVLQDEGGAISYKLIDLGYAKDLREDSIAGSLVGTLNYVAPELLWKERYSCSVDYWSLGILFYELITGTRPFLPRMQHTIAWMTEIKNKGYDNIRAYKSQGKVVFGQDIASPTNLSKILQNKLVEWFKVVLQWDPKRRGKQLDENGTLKLVVFTLLRSILSKPIVYVFCSSTYKLNAYEVEHTTKPIDLQHMIEKDTNISVNQQTLTDYFGKTLTENQLPLLSQIQDPILFVFGNENSLIENIPTPDIPMEITAMVQSSKDLLDFDTFQDYCRVTVFFFKQEIYLFQLYIFALSIKTDLIIARLNTFNQNITNALTNINALLNELSTVHTKRENEPINEEKIASLEIIREKVTKLITATNQIKLKFNSLTQESNQLKDAVQSIDCMKDMSQIYDKAAKMYEVHKSERSYKGTKPTEMIKLVFEFLNLQEGQFRDENISEITKKIPKLEMELRTMESIFNSVTAMTKVYRDKLQSIVHYTFSDVFDDCNKECSNPSSSTQKPTNASSNDNAKALNEFNTNQFPKTAITRHRETMNIDNDVIYDNLLIRYTLDNLLIEMQKRYMELLSLEP